MKSTLKVTLDHSGTQKSQQKELEQFYSTLPQFRLNVKRHKTEQAKKQGRKKQSKTLNTYQTLERIKTEGVFDMNTYSKITQRKLSLEQKVIEVPNFTESVYSKLNSSAKKHSMTTQLPSRTVSKKNTFDFARKKVYTQESILQQEAQQLRPMDDSIIEPKNSCFQVQKAFNKGSLKSRDVQAWLNQALIQYCVDESFDRTIQNPALKKYNIDKNSLISQGLRSEHVERLYKSLFVYSIGFNNMMKQLLVIGKLNNSGLRKTIWKVYAMLLEYCGEGCFEATLAEIQRDKKQKVQYLKEQLQKKQYLIDNNDQINEKKNAKIYKEQKLIKNANEELLQQKSILCEELKQSEQAFSNEVQLRLKFQSKINNLHGSYRQLGDKHANLYRDFQLKDKEIQTLLIKLQASQEIILQLKMDVSSYKIQIKSLNERLKVSERELAEMNDLKREARQELFDKLSETSQYDEIIKQQKNTIAQLEFVSQNASDELNRIKESEKNTAAQNLQILIQISHLQSQGGLQAEQLSRLLFVQKNFNNKIKQITGQNFYLSKKCKSHQVNIKELKFQIQRLREQIETAKIDVELQQKQATSLKHLGLEYQKHISEIKASQKNTADQNQEQYQKCKELYELLQLKLEQQKELRLRIQQLQHENGDLRIRQMTLKSKIELLEMKISIDSNVTNKAAIKNKKEKQTLSNELGSLKTEHLSNQMKVERLVKLNHELQQTVKVHKFQRQSLQLKYHQALRVVSEQQKHIKQLSIRISEIIDQNDVLKRYEIIKKTQLQLLEVELKREGQLYQIEIDRLKKHIFKRKKFLHPMVVEDYQHHLLRVTEKRDQLQQQLANQMSQRKIQQKKSAQNYNQLNGRYKEDKDRLQNRISTMIGSHAEQVEFYKQEVSILNEKVAQLQQSLVIYQEKANKVQIESKAMDKESQYRTKESQYKKAIQEKSTKIQTLISELEKSHDKITQLKKDYLQFEHRLQDKQNELTTYKQQIQALTNQAQRLEKLLDYVSKQKKAIQERLNSLQKSQKARSTKKVSRQQDRSPSMVHVTEDKEAEQSDQENQEGQVFNVPKYQAKELSPQRRQKDFARKFKRAYQYYQR